MLSWRFKAVLPVMLVALQACLSHAGAAQPQAATIGNIVLATMKQKHLKALIVQVRSHGATVYTAVFGDSMSGVPATPAMHFRNGAMAFAYMSTMLLELVDQKKVTLDTKLARFRPDLPNAESITLRNLVSMTSGYADYVYQPQILNGTVFQPFRQWSPEELIHIGVRKPMDFKPGTNWGYSHTNFAILGGVLEKITHMPLNAAMHKYIFGPMNLHQTDGFTTPFIPAPVLHTFSSERRQGLGVKPNVPFYEESTYWNPSWTTFDGAVQTTDVENMGRSMEMIATGKLLSRDSLKELIGAQLIGFGHPAKGCAACRKNTKAFHYGLGVDVFGPWIAQNKLFSGSSATVGYLPAQQTHDHGRSHVPAAGVRRAGKLQRRQPICLYGACKCLGAAYFSETAVTRSEVMQIPHDALGGRPPTSHERLSGRPWDASYHDGPAPWDIGRPQPSIVRMAAEDGLTEPVLDVGCGTGENALYVASLGLPVLGVDVAETALAMARAKAHERGIEIEFAAADALHLERLGRRFSTVLDCGLFHTFDDDERREYVANLANVTEHGATVYVLCFSDVGPDTGPHPVSRDELKSAFNTSDEWNVAAIEPDRVQTRFHDDGAPAWFATIKRM